MSEANVLQHLPEVRRLAEGQTEFLKLVRELNLAEVPFEMLLDLALTGAASAGSYFGTPMCISVQRKVREIKQALIMRHETEIASR